ncbi:hypothetical protein SYNPS1DRAFT_27540 [Syncephalis pseudoplumigaleata]|uniref:Uncharacterized protein n=1 Tax=Syncephalis pseudoplumigaleata TaxID=1712513 RepID=A0A4P9Z2L5_9FUNG|nr:hypothetical protein SYNPS1DRAFT_27540 [Syncephalis pseudoplumigaleata]|eukprot:RKP26777.1 hypothetical protein SYNPS1DRAFT_27540 [Syncephalis pseudoplumigaleata]
MPAKRKHSRVASQSTATAVVDIDIDSNNDDDVTRDLPPTTTITQQTKRQQKRQRFKEKHQQEELLGHNKKDMADYPRAFRMMLKQEMLIKKKKQEQQQVATTTKQSSNAGTESLKMRAGESFNDYTRRLKTETRKQILEMNSESQSKVDRKKKWRAKLKEKEQRKKEKLEADRQQLDFSDLRDDVSFGEVVQQPPTLTAKPKLRGNAAAIAALKAQASSTASSSSSSTTTAATAAAIPKTQGDTLVDETRARHRQRLKTMTPATRRILASERDRVVATYRAMKEAKLQAKLKLMDT